MARSILVLAAILAAAAPAFAGDSILRLRSGKIVVGELVGADDKGVTLKTEGGTARYDWSALTPLCEYEVREEQLAADDAEGRVRLAELCIRNGLYPYARREIDTARGLGYEDTKLLDSLLVVVNEAEADEAFARIAQLMDEEEYEEALAEIRRFVKQAPESEHTRRAKEMANDVIRRIENQRLREEEEAEEAAQEAVSKEKAARIQKYLDEAGTARKEADTAFSAAARDHRLGKTSRAEKGYLSAEKQLMKAHRALKKVRSLSRRGITHDKAVEDQDAVRLKLVDVYLGLANLKIEHRNYKRGIEYVNRVLYLDPVNEEALALRKEVDENRIRRSARSITNTPPVRTSSGAGGGK